MQRLIVLITLCLLTLAAIWPVNIEVSSSHHY